MYSGVAPLFSARFTSASCSQQQLPNHVDVALLTRNEKWRGTIILGQVHICTCGQQLPNHVDVVSMLTRDEKWRATIIIGLVHIRILLAAAVA